MNDITAIAIASTKGTCLPVMMKSIECYIPESVEIYLIHQFDYISFHPRKHILHLEKNRKTNFGDAYNHVMDWAFMKHKNVLICNDDIVFNPNTFETMQRDFSNINEYYKGQVGYVASRTNYSRGVQNIRHFDANDTIENLRWHSESKITETDIIAPICAAISKDSWIDFLPINWYSDDVQCLMMQERGLKNFVGCSYVHHVGSQSIQSQEEENNKALQYLKLHYKKYYHYIVA